MLFFILEEIDGYFAKKADWIPSEICPVCDGKRFIACENPDKAIIFKFMFNEEMQKSAY